MKWYKLIYKNTANTYFFIITKRTVTFNIYFKISMLRLYLEAFYYTSFTQITSLSKINLILRYSYETQLLDEVSLGYYWSTFYFNRKLIIRSKILSNLSSILLKRIGVIQVLLLLTSGNIFLRFGDFTFS